MVEYALLDTPAEYTNGPLTRTMIELPLPDNLPLLTNAQVIIEPRHNNAVTVKPLRQHIVLNRPEAAELPSTVIPENIQFGNAISLEGTSIQVTNSVITIDLYWKANSSIGEDYQVFIHVFDAVGNRVTQLDSSPVNGRYPTSQWRTNTLITDTYEIAHALNGSEYNVRIGLYRLSDGTRLPITQADPRVQDDSLLIGTFGN